MRIPIFKNIKVTGIAGAIPKGIVNNLECHENISIEEKNKTIKLTGVKEYRKASNSICTSDLCFEAAQVLFKSMDVNPELMDAILFVSQTPDYRMPATACLLQNKLGCSNNTIAFDINLGCSGYIYGLYTSFSLINGGSLKRVLLLCGDTQTKFSCSQDKNVNFILGDGGSATIIERCENSSPISFLLRTDGSRYDKMIIQAGGFRNPSTETTREIKQQHDGNSRCQEHVFMNGMDIFAFSVTDVVKTIKQFMKEQNISENNIDYLLLHQANKFMTNKIAKKLKFPKEKVPYSLEKFGNTSSASIPLTLIHNFSKNNRLENKNCLMAGFGVGLSWGVINITFDTICCPPLVFV